MALRLTFGGKPCPSEWGCISEPVADLATDILGCDKWDPSSLHSPQQHLVPDTISLDADIPFASARDTIVDIPAEDHGKCDVYIDDTIAIGPDIPNNVPRLAAAIPLAIHAFCRPLDSAEPVKRDDPLTLNKLLSEGALEEIKILLGCLFDTRHLLIALSNHKFTCWPNELQAIITSMTCTYHDLDSLICRLNYVGYIIPTARHFLSRLRHLLQKSKFKRLIRIPRLVIADLNLWHDFLLQANKGISLNLLTIRSPTHVYRSDSCEHGLGGYSASGIAWRWEIPTHLLARAHINFLEFLWSIVCIWLDILARQIPPSSCLLAMGDSTTAAGWLRKSDFKEKAEDDTETTCKLEAARHLARLIQQVKAMLHSQWFPGEDNVVSDCLSRDLHLSPSRLTQILTSAVPHQLPPNFRIVPLPSTITSWLSSLLARMPVRTERRVKHKTSELEHGVAGPSSYPKSASTTTTVSPDSPSHGSVPFSYPHSPNPCVKPATPGSLMSP